MVKVVNAGVLDFILKFGNFIIFVQQKPWKYVANGLSYTFISFPIHEHFSNFILHFKMYYAVQAGLELLISSDSATLASSTARTTGVHHVPGSHWRDFKELALCEESSFCQKNLIKHVIDFQKFQPHTPPVTSAEVVFYEASAPKHDSLHKC